MAVEVDTGCLPGVAFHIPDGKKYPVNEVGAARASEATHLIEWRDFSAQEGVGVYAIRVLLSPEQDMIAATAINLPGVASQGHTEEEAMRQVHEAAAGAIKAYKEHRMTIPWSQEECSAKPDEKIVVISVHA